MADLKVKISEFPLATESKDSDDIAILQDGVNKRIKTPKIEEKILEKVEERYVNKNKLGVSNGVATLGSDGILSLNQRPPFNVQANFIPINLLSPSSEVDGVFVPTESGVYENYGNIEIDLNDGSYIITKIGEQYEKSLLAVQSPKSVNTISDLRSREGDFDGQIITLLGYYETGDKEPLNYIYTSEQGVDDGGAVINTESGSWVAILNGFINVNDYGIFPTDPDVRVRLNEVIQSIPNDIILVSDPNKNYNVSVNSLGGGIILKSNISIDFKNSSLIAIGSNISSYSIVSISGISDVRIKGLNVVGERDTHTGTTGEHGMGYYITESSNIIIEDFSANKCWGDGIYIGGGSVPCTNITLVNPKCDNNRRQGISITNVDGLVMHKPVCINTDGTAPQAGIDIEPNVGQSVKNVIIENPTCNNNTGSGIEFYNPSSGVAFIENISIIGTANVNNNNTGINISGSHPKTIDNFYADNLIASNNNKNFNFTGLRNSTINNITCENSLSEVNMSIRNSYDCNFGNINIVDLQENHKGVSFERIIRNITIQSLKCRTAHECVLTEASNNNNENVQILGGVVSSENTICFELYSFIRGIINGVTFLKSGSASVRLTRSNSVIVSNNNIIDTQLNGGSSIFSLASNSVGNIISNNNFNKLLGSPLYSIVTDSGSINNYFSDNTLNNISIYEGAQNTNFITNNNYKKYGSTSNRPLNTYTGSLYKDTTLNKWIIKYISTWEELTPNATESVKGVVNRSASVSDILTADAVDLDSALTLLNEIKATLNAKLTADRNSGQQAT